MPDIKKLPEYFRAYSWSAKHPLFGYPADCYDKFEWIGSLEKRYAWLRKNCRCEGTSSIYLLKEMIQWGGSQNGTLQKLEDGLGEVNLQHLMLKTISNLSDTENAISATLEFPGMGLTYASKLLRFLDPERYGALDSRIRKAFADKMPGTLPKIYDSSTTSMVAGYLEFIKYVEDVKTQLNAKDIHRPQSALPVGVGSSQWRSADIEMALFVWASRNEP